MGQIRPSLGKGSNATIPRHMGFSTPICRKVVYDPFCIFFPMMIFWKIKVNYVYLANFKLESGLRIRVTILDRRRRQRVKEGVFDFGIDAHTPQTSLMRVWKSDSVHRIWWEDRDSSLCRRPTSSSPPSRPGTEWDQNPVQNIQHKVNAGLK